MQRGRVGYHQAGPLRSASSPEDAEGAPGRTVRADMGTTTASTAPTMIDCARVSVP